MNITVMKKSLSADSCEVEVYTARGNVYLSFIPTLKGTRRVGESTFAKHCDTRVNNKDFVEALKQASEEMGAIAEQKALKQGGRSSKEIALSLLKEIGKDKLSPSNVVENFLKSAVTWCHVSRRALILKEIFRILGKASTERAEQRKKQEQKETEKAQQGTFSFT